MDLPFTVCPSHSCIKLVHEEEGETHVEFKAWYKSESRYELVRCTFQRAICARAQPWLESSGIGELAETDSEWLSQIHAVQAERYPAHSDSLKAMRHYYISGHDTAVEVIAEGVEWATMGR